jgi:hypothetical protein
MEKLKQEKKLILIWPPNKDRSNSCPKDDNSDLQGKKQVKVEELT